jgi:hypothetical protein
MNLQQIQRQQQASLAGATAFEVYKAKWLREKEARWADELERESAAKASTPE